MVLELLHISLLLRCPLPLDLTTRVRRRWEAQSAGNNRSTGSFAGRRLNAQGVLWQRFQHSPSSHTGNEPSHNVFVLRSRQGAGRVDNDPPSLCHTEPVHQKAALKVGQRIKAVLRHKVLVEAVPAPRLVLENMRNRSIMCAYKMFEKTY